MYFDDLASLDEMYKKIPEDVVRDQWISLVNFWKTKTAKVRTTLLILIISKSYNKMPLKILVSMLFFISNMINNFILASE